MNQIIIRTSSRLESEGAFPFTFIKHKSNLTKGCEMNIEASCREKVLSL